MSGMKMWTSYPNKNVAGLLIYDETNPRTNLRATDSHPFWLAELSRLLGGVRILRGRMERIVTLRVPMYRYVCPYHKCESCTVKVCSQTHT